MNRRSQLLSHDPAALRAALLRHARLDGPSPQARQRVLESVAAAGAVSVGAGLLAAGAIKQAGAVSTAKVGSLVVAKWAVSGALAATAALGVREAALRYEADRAPREPTTAVEASTPRPHRQGGSHTAVSASSAGSEARSLPGDGPPPLAPEAQSGAPAPDETGHPSTSLAAPRGDKEIGDRESNVPPVATTASPTADQAPPIAPRNDSITVGLSHELALLEKTRAHLAQQAPLSALDVLSDYQRSFPAGALRIEAWALRVEALAAAGHRQEAANLARAFLASYPANPMAHRVRTLVLLLEKTPGGP